MRPWRWWRALRRLGGRALGGGHSLRITREGRWYVVAWVVLLTAGLWQQMNLILLTAGLAAGPIVASLFISAATLRGLAVARRSPPYAFADDPLTLDYALENRRRSAAALAIAVEDELAPADRPAPGSGPARLRPEVVFARVVGREKARVRWEGTAPRRGRYRFGTIDLVTRGPFGLWERRVTAEAPGALVVYPTVGRLSRHWLKLQRESSQTRRGRRHDRTAQQQEYHGLRDYRPGDSPRWIHWRTTARLGEPMVKEFEQQNEQELVVLVDPWLPRSKVTPGQREAVESALRFAATLCLETCRDAGRRLTLGWTGPTPGVLQGPASVKLLHEMLEALAVLRPATEGGLAALLDALPPATLREGLLVIVGTRPLNLAEEAERSARLRGAGGRGLAGRVLLLDAALGELDGMIRFDRGGAASTATLGRRADDDEPGSGPGSAPPPAAEAPTEAARP